SRRQFANARENDRIGRGRTRLRPAHLVIIRSTELELMDKRPLRWRDERARFRIAAAQAGAIQRVKYALRGIRMEIHIEDFARVALTDIMAGMLPLAADARVPQWTMRAVHLIERRTQLTNMAESVDGDSAAALDRGEWEQLRLDLGARVVS